MAFATIAVTGGAGSAVPLRVKLKQTSLVTLACLAFLAGLVFGRHAAIAGVLVVLALTLTGLLWRTRLRILLVIVAFLLVGGWRAGQVTKYDTGLMSQMGRKVTLAGMVTDDPSLNDNNQLSLSVAVNRLNDQPYHATVSVFTYRLPVKRGYRVVVSGTLKPALGASIAELSFPALQITSDKLSLLERTRLRFFAAERAAIPEPMASFALGLLVGARTLIPKTLQGQLAAVGLSHLVAVSGYNLTILVNAVRRFLKRSGKFFVLAVSLWLIIGFVAVAGASASIVRAAVVSILVLAAGYYGRSIRPAVLIALAAAATAGFNPHSLWSDLGWQLSFAAFIGILMVAPPLSHRLGGERHGSIALVFEALAAYVMTLPLILHSFGTLAIVAPLVNVLVMPLVPIAMLASFMAGLGALLLPVLGGWIAWPAAIILRFIVGIIEHTAKVAPAKITVPASFVILWYVLAAIIIILLNRPQKATPTWYNEREEEGQEDVRTLKVA